MQSIQETLKDKRTRSVLEANSLGVIAPIKTEAKDVRLVPACWASERDLHCSPLTSLGH